MSERTDNQNTLPQFLAIKNWRKYQPPLENAEAKRDWIRVDTNLEDNFEFSRLSFYQRGVLLGLWRIRGRISSNIPYDVQYIRRALAMTPQESCCLRAALELLISCGFLVLCNQRFDLHKTGQDKTDKTDKTGQDETGRDREDPFFGNLEDTPASSPKTQPEISSGIKDTLHCKSSAATSGNSDQETTSLPQVPLTPLPSSGPAHKSWLDQERELEEENIF